MTKAKEEQVKELSFEDKLIQQINHLESESRNAEAKFHQVIGALSQAKSTLDEFKKSK